MIYNIRRTVYKLWAEISQLICNKAFERKNDNMIKLSEHLIQS